MNKWKNSKPRSRMKYEDIQTGGNPSTPQKDEPKTYDTLISEKALRDLPRTPISMQADPYQNALPGTMPYPLLNKFNRIIGGRYGGQKNLDGGTTVQYNNTYNSNFLRIFDCAMARLGLNYRFLPIMTSDTKRGKYMIDEMRKAIAEVCSTFAATTFYNQNIFYYAIDTDMPMGSAVKHEVGSGNKKKMLYTEIQDVIYATGIMYQLCLQKVALAFNQFNAFRLRQGEMIRMSFNRETPGLNSFFGLMNKKAFLNLWDSLAYTIEGEYLDTDFMAQANVFALSASRRSNSINDPLLEIFATFNMPDNFKMYILPEYAAGASGTTIIPEEPVFDLAKMTYEIDGQVKTFDEVCQDLAQKCSATDTLQYVRTTPLNRINVSQNARYNAMKDDLDSLTNMMTYFKIAFSDFRTVLDVLTRSGLNSWKKSVKMKIINDTDTAMFQNLVVDNVYQLILSGCDKVTFDNRTKRWSLYTVWNQYYGIPEHDSYSGGVFFTLSTKEMDDIQTDTDSTINYLPIAFDVKKSTGLGTIVKAINRLGHDAPISYDVIRGSENRVFSRLFPLQSQSEYNIRIPKLALSYDQMTITLDKVEQAFIYKFMLQIVGAASLPTANNTDYGLDSDIFSIYDIQIEDFTNEVITYARSKGPFIVNAVDNTKLGFYGMSIGHK